MGTMGREIVGANVQHVIELLNRAYADEWLGYYQYWLGAKLVSGPLSDAVAARMLEHAADELRHAELLATRIIQIEGEPVLSPDRWHGASNCKYEPPTNPLVQAILEQNILVEQCAIRVYDDLRKEVFANDPLTHKLVVQLLEDEVEHEERLQALYEDVKLMIMKP